MNNKRSSDKRKEKNKFKMLKQEFVEKEGIVSLSGTEVSGTAYNCSTCTAMFTDPNAFMDHITNGHIGLNDIQFWSFV